MSDLFLEEIPDAHRDRVFEAIERAPWHRYQILTKRPEVAARYFEDAGHRMARRDGGA